MAKVYPTDLTDEQWARIRPLLTPPRRGGRPRTVDLRLVVNAIFYLNKAGCQWGMLPTDLARRSTAHDYFTAWKADGAWQQILDTLRRQVRVAAGHGPEPGKAAIDSQTVKGSEAGGARLRRWQEGHGSEAPSGRG
jgi:putative transposase